MKLIHKHINSIEALCKKYNIAEKYVFGSILTDQFNKNSDIDFLVQFTDVEPLDYFDNFMDFKESLEDLLSRNIDLVEIQTLKNPILKRSIYRNKRFIYGREDSKIVV